MRVGDHGKERTVPTDDLHVQLKAVGYAITSGPMSSLPDAMLRIAQCLGRPVPGRGGGAIVEPLPMVDVYEARPRSLSRRYGLGTQPWHVDGAHRPILPRYLVIGCTGLAGNDAPTTQLLATSACQPLCDRAAFCEPFAVRNGKNSFYSFVASRDRAWVRYDPGCMAPTTESGRRLSETLIFRDIEPSFELEWMVARILVIDNWSVFHRRSVRLGGGQRTLMRITVMEP